MMKIYTHREWVISRKCMTCIQSLYWARVHPENVHSFVFGLFCCGDIIVLSGQYQRSKIYSLWSTDAIWKHNSLPIMVQLKACCLSAPSHFWINVDKSWVRLRGIHMKAISQWVPPLLFYIMCLKKAWASNYIPYVIFMMTPGYELFNQNWIKGGCSLNRLLKKYRTTTVSKFTRCGCNHLFISGVYFLQRLTRVCNIIIRRVWLNCTAQPWVILAYIHVCSAWWRHQMETFSALLAPCPGNSPVTGEFPHNGQWRGALMFSLIYAWINGWVNNRKAGDFRRNRAHYDVTLMDRIKLMLHKRVIWPKIPSSRSVSEIEWTWRRWFWKSLQNKDVLQMTFSCEYVAWHKIVVIS